MIARWIRIILVVLLGAVFSAVFVLMDAAYHKARAMPPVSEGEAVSAAEAQSLAPLMVGTGVFSDSGQSLGSSSSQSVALGDLDVDGDLDAFVANHGANMVWVNDGSGVFTDSTQSLGSSTSHGVALGDVDGDGDLDAFIANYDQDDKVWLNDGSGVFTDSLQSLGGARYGQGVVLTDLDKDGDLDAYVVNGGAGFEYNNVFLNNGSGSFTDNTQSWESTSSLGLALGDLDGDGDVDAFVANGSGSNPASKVWKNNGSGTFSRTQNVGNAYSYAVALGDIDKDGDLDAFVINMNSQANQVWRNNGSGSFSNPDAGLGSSSSAGVALGDVDEDGDLDAFVANSGANKVWENGGTGTFTDGGQSLGSSGSLGVALGDLDEDGDLDAFVANGSSQGNRVWLDGPATYVIAGQVKDDGGTALSTVTVSDDAGHNALTDDTGVYALTGLVAGAYAITPTRSGYHFDPVSRSVTVPPDATGQHFTATLGVLPDLTVTDVYLSDNYKPYHPHLIHVGATISNTGEYTAADATISYYVDSVQTGNLIGTHVHGEDLGPNEQKHSLYITYTLPITVWENHDIVVKVSTSTGDNDTSNNSRTERFSVYYTDFRMDRDAFKDENPPWDYWMWKGFWEHKLSTWVGNWMGPAFMVLAKDVLGMDIQTGGHCYGLSHASISYFKDPTTKPVAKETFQMIESEYLSDVRERHWLQLPMLADIIQNGYDNPRDEYAKAELYLKSGMPVIVTESPQGGGGKGKHVVVGYKIIKEQAQDGTPTRAFLYTYDNNAPMSTLYENHNQPCIVFQDFDTATGSVLSGQNYWWGYKVWANQGWGFVDISIPDSFSISGLVAADVASQTQSDQEAIQAIANSAIQDLVSDDQIMIVLASDVADGLITDSQGRRIGWVSGNLINEIPGASYEITGTMQLEAFYLPAAETYTVQSFGTGSSGSGISALAQEMFDLSTYVPNESGALDVASYEEVATTDTTIATLAVARGNTDLTLRIDTNGDGTVDQTQEPDLEGTATVSHGGYVYLPTIIKQ